MVFSAHHGFDSPWLPERSTWSTDVSGLTCTVSSWVGKASHEWATFHREYYGNIWKYSHGLWWFMMVYGISWKSKPSQTIIFSMILAVLPREHFGQSLFLDQLKCLESKKNLWKTWKKYIRSFIVFSLVSGLPSLMSCPQALVDIRGYGH